MTLSFGERTPRHRRAVPAREITAGDRFMRRSGMPSEPVRTVQTARDSFGSDAYVEATLADGSRVTIAVGSTIRVFTEREAGPGLDELLAIPVEAGSAEAALVEVASDHPRHRTLMDVALRLAPGINQRAGAHLDDLAWAAHQMVVVYQETERAVPVLAVLCDQDFDGHVGRWLPVRQGLALASWLARETGDHDAAQDLASRLTDGEDDFIASLPGPAQEIRRRQLAQPSLFDREIQRARDTGETESELELRWQRLQTLLFQLAHGRGHLADDEALRLIQREATLIREASGTQETRTS